MIEYYNRMVTGGMPVLIQRTQSATEHVNEDLIKKIRLVRSFIGLKTTRPTLSVARTVWP